MQVAYGNDARVTHGKDRRSEAEKFGAIVRTLRESRGLTQHQLADIAEVSPTYNRAWRQRPDSNNHSAARLGPRRAEMLRSFESPTGKGG